MCSTHASNIMQVSGAIRNLRAATNEAERLSTQLMTQVEKRSLVTEIRRTQHALSRRLDLWELVPASQMVATQNQNGPDPARLGLCLAQAVEFLQQGEDFDGWREYLMLDALVQLAQDRATSRSEWHKQCDVARDALEKLHSDELDVEQQKYLSEQALAGLSSEPANLARRAGRLPGYADGPGEIRRLGFAQRCAAGGRIRQTSGRLGRRIGAKVGREIGCELSIGQSAHRGVGRPAQSVDAGAAEPAGTGPRGFHGCADAGLERNFDAARRAADSRSESLAFHSGCRRTGECFDLFDQRTGHTFWPERIILHGGEKDRVRSARHQGIVRRSRRRLHAGTGRGANDFRSNSVAGWHRQGNRGNEHAARGGEIRHEMRRKISARVQEQIDSNIDPRLAKVNRVLKERVLSPLERLELEPLFASMQTTTERASMRVRLAGDEQLAANTPRPSATGDSLISMQIHESLLNNLIERLELDGQTFTPAELQDKIASKLNLKLPPLPESIPQNVLLTLAPQNALRLHCEEGLISMTLAVEDLARGNEHWRDFVVKVHYKPEMAGLDAWLSREGVIQLAGPR